MARGPKIAVLGAGSVGCFIGGAWAVAGLPVTFIGRPRLAKAVGECGMTLSDNLGWEAHLSPDQIDFRCDPGALGDTRIILVTVKSGDTTAAANEIAKHGTAGALVISFQNGISNVDVIKQALGNRFEVARGMVPYNVAYLGDGRFHKGVAGELIVERCDMTRELARAVGEGPATLGLNDDMLGLAWGKLLINLNNAVNALSGKSLRAQLQSRAYRRIFAAAIREGLDLLKFAGIRPATVGPIAPQSMPRMINTPDWLFNNLLLKRWKIDARARSSMADDLAAGRKTEIDYLNGELVKLADRLGRAAPVNRAIVELVRQAEAGAPLLSEAEFTQTILGV